MRILFIGDIFGRPGRRVLADHLADIVAGKQVDLVLANGENAAAGFGITPRLAEELFGLGIEVITTGNHVWDKKEAEGYLAKENRVLRPANYPEEVPGVGTHILRKSGRLLGVLNIQGRAFLPSIDCPFKTVDRELIQLRQVTDAILVDCHAEATAEKQAFGWYVDGRVSAVIGTHTHVQTADERVLPRGTAYITDLGMTGPHDSVIGSVQDLALERFLKQIPIRLEPATGNARLCGAVVQVDESTGRGQSIQRINLPSNG